MKRVTDIFLRYAILLAVSFPGLWLFYFIFTPLTIYLTFFLIKIFFNASLNGNLISFGNCSIKLIGSCVAGAAYYLLLILNLATPGIKIKKRIYLIALAFFSFLVLNVLRIFVLSVILQSNFELFTITHEIFWYALSTVFVIGIWFAEVKIFRIKNIPFYSDVKYLFKKSHFKRK